jgi:hypothetical protein
MRANTIPRLVVDTHTHTHGPDKEEREKERERKKASGKDDGEKIK